MVGTPTTLFSKISYTDNVGIPTGDLYMRLVDAVYARIIELVKNRGITVNALANLSGVPRSTILTMTRSATVKLSTVYGICDGLKITLQEFFDSPLFALENITD